MEATAGKNPSSTRQVRDIVQSELSKAEALRDDFLMDAELINGTCRCLFPKWNSWRQRIGSTHGATVNP
jgi:hypothetical protein